ncbi:OLC1v1019588C1 [Oldenlandia corymbosa var. corymbosa]|uniref:OLC1v1019588C1 n=1 Tax=Oldenlandia corymbosa var. corymbosa TaxID=529605 RepID=A0AAV1EER8_OLDCO|nr:OLC1v1019588C1 [Oldenlandia corymbosa var. corymbosa]
MYLKSGAGELLAIEAVKRTGCQYTGITLSEKQLEFAQCKVKEAGLQPLRLGVGREWGYCPTILINTRSEVRRIQKKPKFH